MKGIILAGGNGTRLDPITKVINKHLLPVYDKPMIFYPLGTLMSLDIRDILVICRTQDKNLFEQYLGDYHQLGISIKYATQNNANGIAESFIIAEDFIGNDNVTLILGDNIFYGTEISGNHIKAKCVFSKNTEQAYIFSYNVHDPQRFGVVEVNKQGKIISLEEKPEKPKSNLAVTGIYMYDSSVVKKAKSLKPSKRGELEVTGINNMYLKNNSLELIQFKRGFSWLDAGTVNSFMEAAQFIQNIEQRQGLKISCLEEIAFNKGFIDKNQFKKLLNNYHRNSDYYDYLTSVLLN